MNYALVENGVVTNLIWLYPSNAAGTPPSATAGTARSSLGTASRC